jgi:hypothetical protein
MPARVTRGHLTIKTGSPGGSKLSYDQKNNFLQMSARPIRV